MMKTSDGDKKKVRFFHRLNKLKLKAGGDPNSKASGFFDPEKVKQAQSFINQQEKNYISEVRMALDMLRNTWTELKAEKADASIQSKLSWMYNYANNIKDMAETYDYELMGFFGKSLRDFCEYIDLRNAAHHVIVQAHIDAMRATCEDNIRDYSNPRAEELKSSVMKAIEKYS